MDCPVCSGPTFDNVAENAQRKARGEKLRPNYKCRDKDCAGVIWPPKDSARPAPKAAANVKGAYSGGPHIPGLDPEPDEQHPELPHEKLDKLFALYSLCYARAYETVGKVYGLDGATPVAVTAAAATLFIAAKERGLAA